MTLYLADSSVWIGARNRRGTYLPDLLTGRIEREEIATYIPVALKVLSGPRPLPSSTATGKGSGRTCVASR